MEIVIIIFLIFNYWILDRRVQELQKYEKSEDELIYKLDYEVKDLKKFIRFQHKSNTTLSEKNRLLRLQQEPISLEEIKTIILFSNSN